MRHPVPLVGAKVRLLSDVETRGGRTFRRGLEMSVFNDDREYGLQVRARGTWHYIRLLKKDYPRKFEVIDNPERATDLITRNPVQITLKKEVLKATGFQPFKDFGASADDIKYNHNHTITLTSLTQARCKKLLEVLQKHAKIGDLAARAIDVQTWIEACSGKDPKVRKIEDFATMLKQYMMDKPGKWLYQKIEGMDVWQPYYVGKITYHAPSQYSPPKVSVELWRKELGQFIKDADFYNWSEVRGRTAKQILAESGYTVETPQLLLDYRKQCDRYAAIHEKIGSQYLATGLATDNVDTADDNEDRHWYRRNTNKLRLDRGEATRVVMDVVNESGKENTDRDEAPDAGFWKFRACDYDGDEEEDDRDLKPGDDDEIETPIANVPLCPRVVIFDMARHKRLRVHISQLTDYKYNPELANKLILPDENRDLVDMLVSNKTGFKDVIGNKGNSSIILCSGRPGTGKTLTAEVYAEAMKRPLYSVQCSQLGLKPDELEKELFKVFSRAVRWSAILLIDEADVYVAARGSNLEQNAIVGVFLRVLEYYQGVMFMTTNRADLVDDAIASRCLAKIEYTAPSPENQKRIWRVLSDSSGVAIKDAEIDKVVKKFPKLSGRDCKSLLKLASMVAEASNKPVDAKIIEFAKRFKPTEDSEK